MKSTLSLEQQRELLGREPELGNNSMAWAVRQAMVAARYETIWQDAQTKIILDYPIFDGPPEKGLHEDAALTLLDVAYQAQLDKDAKQREERKQQERRDIFGR